MALLIPNTQLQNWNEIDSGSFGDVYRVSWKSPNGRKLVAVKCLKNDLAAFAWAEVNRMLPLDHPNVIKLLGIVPPGADDGDAPAIVTEFMSNGNLGAFLGSKTVSMNRKKAFSYRIACGMEYLHFHVDPPIVHGDLAARNILVGPRGQIKIADFGLMGMDGANRAIYYYLQQHGIRFPVRWMPAENLPENDAQQPEFTKEGDVWSYGVTLYELWTNADHLPYSKIRQNNAVLLSIKEGKNPLNYHSDVEFNGPPSIRELLESCFNVEPDERPDFHEIMATFETDGMEADA